jgi:hypothetical protein
MTPTNCDALGFAPKAKGSMGAPGQTDLGDFPPVSTTLVFDPEEAALQRAEVILPQALGGNLTGAQRACPRELADASNCPDSARVGTAIIDSPLQPQPVRGPVYIAFNTDALFPGLLVLLPAPVSVRLDGVVEPLPALGTQNTFASNPDLPVRSFTLEFEGGRPDALLTLQQDLCGLRTDTSMSVRLVAHNGKVSQFDQELATPGCDPLAKVAIRRNRNKPRQVRLIAKLRRARDGQGITKFDLRLPKTLRGGKTRPYVLADGRRLRPTVRPRRVSMTLPREARSVRVVWRGLRARPKLRRIAVVRLRMIDARDKATALKPRVRVQGKLPKPRRG